MLFLYQVKFEKWPSENVPSLGPAQTSILQGNIQQKSLTFFFRKWQSTGRLASSKIMNRVFVVSHSFALFHCEL